MARQMKLSGVESMGDIPVTWSVVRVKDLCNENCEQLTTLPDEIRYVDIGSVSVNGIKSIQHLKKVDIPSRARRLPQKGDIIVSNVRTYLRAITRVMEEGLVVSTGFSVFTPLTNTFPEFMFYTLQSDSFMDQVDASSKGISYPAISGSALRNLKIVQPSLNEQVAIASFLDDRTTAIDSKIQLLEEKATALADLRKSVIHQAVTKGLDPNVAMKTSNGVETPAHWESLRAGAHFIETIERATSNGEVLTCSIEHGIMPQTDFTELTGRRLSKPIQEKDNYKCVSIGDFVYNKMRMWQGAVGLSQYAGVVSPAYVTLRAKNRAANSFYKWVLKSDYFVAQANLNSYGICDDQNSLRYRDFQTLMIHTPPLSEQLTIATYLDERTTIIDESIKIINAQINALKSLRQSLIHEAVTGKIDVADYGYNYELSPP